MSELDDLKKRLAVLEAKLEIEPPPPAKPFVPPPPRPYYDPTEAMSPPIRISEWERRNSPKQSAEEFRKSLYPQQLPTVAPADPVPPAVGVTVPIGPPPGIAAIDAIAKGFADRERAEAIANQMDVARKLMGK
jgi:hypothetical protein